nr:hypothetical protein [Tanacetum cinerariifolium]
MAEINKNLMRVLQVNQQVKAVTPNCETCGCPHSYNDFPATVGQTQNVYAVGAWKRILKKNTKTKPKTTKPNTERKRSRKTKSFEAKVKSQSPRSTKVNPGNRFNQPNVSGPTWLFDIDTLTQSMNYQPVVAANQPNSSAGIQGNFNAGKVVQEAKSAQQYVLLPLWSIGSKDPHNTDADAAFDDKENDSEVHVSPSSSDKLKKHDEKAIREAKGKSHVDFPSDNVVSPTFKIGGKSSFMDPSHYPDDPNMPALEDIVYSDDEEDVGAEAYFSNLETSITTRSMARMVKEQVGLTQINDEDFHTCMFACFLSQEELKRVHQALKDPSWIEAMQEELLQFKMQKVWVLVDLPKGFEEPDYPDKVYKVVKALYGLHQAPRAWKFGLTYGKSASTPIDTKKPLLKDPNGKDIDVHIYRSMIGSLMYPTSSRPDIMFVVYAWARFQVTLKASHLHAVKRNFSDYAGASIDKKSTTRGCQFLGRRLISWQCKKHTVVATSLTKAEYVAATSCCSQYQVDEQDGIAVTAVRHFLNAVSSKLMLFGLTINAAHLMLLDHNQFWTSVSIKKSNDVVRLQALVDRKKVIITKDTIIQALRLDDAAGVDCLHNEEIFAELARMGYEKPSIKLTFYKVFFSAQWKFLIHIILQCMSAKRTASNEFSSFMASAIICLATVRKFNFSKCIFDSMYTSPALTQKVFVNMRRIGKGFLRVDTPLFDEMLVQQQVQAVEDAAEDEDDDNEAVGEEETIQIFRIKDIKEGGEIAELDADEDVTLVDAKEDMNADVQGRLAKSQVKVYHLDLQHAKNVLSMQDTDETEPAEVEKVIEVVTAAKLITKVVTIAATTITTAQVPKASAAKRRRGVVIQDLEEIATVSVIVHFKVKSKDKGKGILIKELKPLKRQAQIEQDEAFTRQLEAELNSNINWHDVMKQVKRREKQDNTIMRY